MGWGAAMSLECVRIRFGAGMFPVNLRQGFKTPSYQVSVQNTRGLRHRLSSKLRSALDDDCQSSGSQTVPEPSEGPDKAQVAGSCAREFLMQQVWVGAENLHFPQAPRHAAGAGTHLGGLEEAAAGGAGRRGRRRRWCATHSVSFLIPQPWEREGFVSPRPGAGGERGAALARCLKPKSGGRLAPVIARGR